MKLTPAAIGRVAREVDEETARWAFTQWALRERARAKCVRADEMLFDREGLEMATHEAIAAYHASRFPPGTLVIDLTCGVGIDLIALAARGPAIGFELDPVRAELARFNLAAHGFAAEVRVTDCLEAHWDAQYAIADPARRSGGRRMARIEEYLPDPRRIAVRMADLRLGLIKLSPMLPDVELERLGPGLEFVGHGGECREALVMCGYEAPSGRWATLATGERLAACPPPPRAERADAWLMEAHPAAIRAHALGNFAPLKALGDSNGYLTGSEPVNSPWLRAFRVLADHPADWPRTVRVLADLGAARPILKQRGAGEDLDRRARRLPAHGDRPVAVALWAVGRRLRHTVLDLR